MAVQSPTHAWQTSDDPVRLVEQTWQKNDPEAKALVCYGVLWQRGLARALRRNQMPLRFVDGHPDIPGSSGAGYHPLPQQEITWHSR